MIESIKQNKKPFYNDYVNSKLARTSSEMRRYTHCQKILIELIRNLIENSLKC